MNYRTLGQPGLKVSEISFGAWGWGETPEAEAIAAIRRARELGVNFFDTADVYGNGRSEEVLGKALSSEWDKVYVASKVGNVVRNGVGGKDWSRKHIVSSCEASLRRLKKDVIDLYQLHNPDQSDIQKGDWPETLELLQKQGKIRWYGISVFLPEEGMAVLERGKGQVIQLAYNALRLEMEERVLPLAQKKDVGIIARVPLYYGILAGKFKPDTTFASDDHRSHTLPPSTMRELVPRASRLQKLAGITPGDSAAFGKWSLKFILSHPAVSTVIPGARNPQQAEKNSSASDGQSLPNDQVERVRKFWREDSWLWELRTGL